MSSILKVFGIGQNGINVSSDALHVDDNDVVVAQNAIFYGSGESGGLAKRGGLRIMNSTALNGAVLAMFAVNFTDPTPGSILTDNDGATLTDDAFLVLVE